MHVFARKGYPNCIESIMEKTSAMKNGIGENVLVNLLREVDCDGNTPLMCAAVHEKSETLARLLLFYYGKPQHQILSNMLHHKNKDGSSILSIVHRASKTMFGPYGILLELEKLAHMKSEEDTDGFLELQDCLRSNSGSSDKTIKTLNMLKGTTPWSIPKKVLVDLKLIVAICLVPLCFYLSDVITDSLMSQLYYNGWMDEDYIHDNSTRVKKCNFS
jgi:hypothetical protein